LKTPSGLQLEKDQKLTVQEHLNVLTQQATLIFALVIVLTGLMMTQIDEILQWVLNRMNPCQTTECLTLYEPASWSVVRWLTAVFLAVMCILPLIVGLFYQFAQPGLTKKEKICLENGQSFRYVESISYCSYFSSMQSLCSTILVMEFTMKSD
jgi:Sec-independent protein secretion pathway component TatC